MLFISNSLIFFECYAIIDVNNAILLDLLWRSRFSTKYPELSPRVVYPNRPFDACRIYGSLILNKVAGNFHITAGKSLNLPRGHVHINAFMSERDYNFSHRINKFSFGDPSPGIVHPLEGDEIISNFGKFHLITQ